MYGDSNKFNIRSRFDTKNKSNQNETEPESEENKYNTDDVPDEAVNSGESDTEAEDAYQGAEPDNSIRDMEQSILDIDDSDCMWNYMNKVSIQGRLYFNQYVKVSDTALGTQVAAFNLLIKKESKNGVKRHRIYVKTYNRAVVEWLKEQKVGTWVRVDGRLESVSGKNYVNATNVQSFSDNHMKAIFDDNPQKLVDWELSEKKNDNNQGKNNQEIQSKLQQIKNQTRTILNHSNNVSIEENEEDDDKEENAIANAIATVDYELTQSDMAEIGILTRAVLIPNNDDDDMSNDLDEKYSDTQSDDDEYDDDEEDEEDGDDNKYSSDKEDTDKDDEVDRDDEVVFPEGGFQHPLFELDADGNRIIPERPYGYSYYDEDDEPDPNAPKPEMATKEELMGIFGQLYARLHPKPVIHTQKPPVRGRLIKKQKDNKESSSKFKSRFD